MKFMFNIMNEILMNILNNFFFSSFFRNPKMIIRELGMNAMNYEMDVLVIFMHSVLFKALAYFVLKHRLKNI